jgi:hypothetical protein
MKHLSQDKIEELSKFKSKKFLTTSFYFDTDKSRLIKKEISVSFKNLLNSNKSQIDKIDLSKEKKASLEKDLGKIERFFKRNIDFLKETSAPTIIRDWLFSPVMERISGRNSFFLIHPGIGSYSTIILTSGLFLLS